MCTNTACYRIATLSRSLTHDHATLKHLCEAGLDPHGAGQSPGLGGGAIGVSVHRDDLLSKLVRARGGGKGGGATCVKQCKKPTLPC